MKKTNEILRQYYLNLFSSSAEITKNGNNNYIYKWNIRDLKLNNAEMALIQIANNRAILTDERQYPPKLYNSFTEETELIYLDQNPVYYETINLNNDNITYGNGTYELYYSSSIASSRIKSLFNYVLNDTTPNFGGNRYIIPSGNYNYPIYSNKIIDGSFGDFVIIKLPSPIILTKFIFNIRSDIPEAGPSLWKCYGSIDGVNYTEIKTGSNDVNALNISSYTDSKFEKIVNETNQIAYQYIGFTFNKIIGGVGIASLSFSEIQIFGREKIKKFTEERQYPSKAYNTFTTEVLSTGEILNILPTTYYKEVISLDTDGITYGSGDYVIFSSNTTTDITRTRARLFNRTTTPLFQDAGAYWGYGSYNASTGYFQSNKYIKSDYLGEWSIVKLSSPIILRKYIFYGVPGSIPRAPSLWKFYGSNDGINFIEIIEASISTPLTISDYVSSKYEKILNPIFNIPYLYIGFTFNKIIGVEGATGSQTLAITELELFGQEDTGINNIVIKTLNVYDDGYCSQNREAILYMGNDFRLKKPTYHKLISKNLNSISLAITDDFNAPTNGIRSDIDIGLIIHVKDYKNQQDNNL